MSQLSEGDWAFGSPFAAARAPAETVVLVVDPEPSRGSFIGHALRRRFGEVHAAATLAEAQAQAHRHGGGHVILLLAAPAQVDFDRLHGLYEACPTLDCIVLAEAADVDMAVAALRAGVADFLVQPCGVDHLAQAISRVQQRRQRLAGAPSVVNTTAPPAPPPASTGDAAVGLVGECKPVKAICRIIDQVAPMPSTVLIKGESGTGKELAARAIHDRSGRRGEFVPINCGAVSAELLESELFGHVKGAFTGAHQAREGLFGHAHGGTLFLDEIGEMPLGLQAKLLRVLEEKRVRPVGGNEQIAVDARIIAATNRDLAAEVQAGRFREDLYYRLNVLEVHLPPLRERREDIPALAQFFVATLARELGVTPPELADADLAVLSAHRWPGNVRELRNLIERCLLLGLRPRDCVHTLGSVLPGREPADDSDRSLASAERRHILQVLREVNGNRNLAASMLGVSRKTIERKLRQWAEQPDAAGEVWTNDSEVRQPR